jgi:hypothetical protein
MANGNGRAQGTVDPETQAYWHRYGTHTYCETTGAGACAAIVAARFAAYGRFLAAADASERALSAWSGARRSGDGGAVVTAWSQVVSTGRARAQALADWRELS